jgi:KUP system potassium uptake protein
MPDSHLESNIEQGTGKQALKFSLVLASLGVVFGDIGTSPLYALRECFSGNHAIPIVRDNILGSVSLIFWLIFLIVCVKYVILLMKADNKGEGGIMALMALIDRISPVAKKYSVLITLCGILGAALLCSDAVLTPLVTVTSAVEGLNVIAPVFERLVVPISVIILIALFVIQSKGTAKVGMLFGPILLLWFITISVVGIAGIVMNFEIFYALNPYYAIKMMISNPHNALLIIGTAILSVTGAEVLYADMGHFGKRPIQTGWFAIVFPSLVLNYMGQGAFLLSGAETADNLFFRIAPSWFVLPLVIIATLSSAIASQAVITGIFSLLRQAVQLGFWPRLRIIHTSAHTIGQVFIPSANWLLCIATVILIIMFQDSSSFTNAYGIAVTATMLLTTIMAIFVARQVWKAPTPVIIIIWVFFVILNAVLFAATMTKVIAGGWVVITFAVVLSSLMYTWVAGRKMLGRRFASEAVPLNLFIADIVNLQPIRVKGIAVFLSANVGGTPRPLLHNYKHNKVIHETTIIVNLQNVDVPTVSRHDRAEVTDLGHGIIQVLLKFGFMETPNVPQILSKISLPVHFDQMQVTYFLGKERLVVSKKKSMFIWQKHVFRYLAHNSLDATTFFGLPSNRVVELGMQIDL